MIWIDPDWPDEVFDKHWLASSRRPAPLRFRADDYGTADAPVGADAVRTELRRVVGGACDGPVRMLTQPRKWGWLFNPLTLYFAWTSEEREPIGVVAEVTNTPWKERHRYAVPLEPHGSVSTATFDKVLHVSPFLSEDYRYVIRAESDGSTLQIDLDIVDDAKTPTLEASLLLERKMPTRKRLRQLALNDPLSTYKVSGGIHFNAARLWRKGVPVVPHATARGQLHEESTPS